jgi:hypothetical protein
MIYAPKTLEELDISGNYIGDVAFAALAGAIRHNKALRSLKCDNNKVTPSGYQALRNALRYNKIVCRWEWPMSDFKNSCGGTEASIRLIDDITIAMVKNGDYTPLEDVMLFQQDWPTPSRPAPSLPDVPQFLKEHVSSEDVFKESATRTVTAAPPAPTSTPTPPNVSNGTRRDTDYRPPDEVPPPPPPSFTPAPPAAPPVAPPGYAVNVHYSSFAFE